jgi:hypothetical protein
MTSVISMSHAGRIGILSIAALVAAGTASAQIAFSHDDSSHAAAVSAADSSSNGGQLFIDSSDAPDPGGTPAAPAPAAGAAGGQYDNSAGRGGHDWKSRLAFEAGGGFNVPSSYTSSYLNTGFNVTVGGGLRFGHVLSLLAEYQYIYDGLPNAIVAETGASGGNADIWSLTLDPVIDLMPKKRTSVYVTGGGGFYRKVTNFTDPVPTLYCTYYYGCGYINQNTVVGHFSSNQGGWNVGGGMTHRFGGMYGEGKMEVFAEARYLDVMTPAVTTAPNGLGVTTVAAGTKLVPISFGVRF